MTARASLVFGSTHPTNVNFQCMYACVSSRTVCALVIKHYKTLLATKEKDPDSILIRWDSSDERFAYYPTL